MMKNFTLLKKTGIAIGILAFYIFSSNDSYAQTVVYDIQYSDMINQTNTCSGVPNEATYTQYDTNPWGFTWTSTGTGTPTSITIEYYRGIDCGAVTGITGELLPITLNGTYETDYTATSDGAACDCDAPTPVTLSFAGTPANYNSGGLNTILIAKSTMDPNTEMGFKVNPAWGNAYARVTVNYCNALTTTVSSSTVCEGEMVTLSATSTSGGNITWDNGVVDNVPFLPLATGTTTYTATSDGVGDCSFSVDIINNPVPLVTTVPDAAICLGDSILLSASGTADVYEWNSGIPNNSYFQPTFSFAHEVVGTTLATGCTSTASVNINVNSVTVVGIGTDELFGNDGAINIAVVGGSTPLTFDWDNDGTGDFDDTEDLTGLVSGTYIVVVQDSVGCTGTTSITIGSQVGIDEEALSFDVYPNPATDDFTIDAIGSFEYSIINVVGQVVMNGQGTNKELVSIEELNSGSYFITIKMNGEIFTTKLIKN